MRMKCHPARRVTVLAVAKPRDQVVVRLESRRGGSRLRPGASQLQRLREKQIPLTVPWIKWRRAVAT
jgi:hypothetical protein